MAAGPSRRHLLHGGLATAALATLAGCAVGGSNNGANSKADKVKTTEQNPFGISTSSTIDAVIFDGGYGYDYVTFSGTQLTKQFPKIQVEVNASTTIAQQLQPRFVGGNPPDLVNNGGAGQIGLNTILDQLEPLDDLFAAKNYEGDTIADTLYPGVKDPGTFSGKFLVMNYAMTVYALWYSRTLFDELGLTEPRTWDDLLGLGAKAKEQGKYLFVWGKEASTYYQTLAIDSAIKQGGHEVRLGLENLTPDCWSHPALQEVFGMLESCVSQGYFMPGGAGTQFTAAQAKWSNDREVLFYPSGGWIENEMKKATSANFQMIGCATPTLTSTPQLPHTAMRSAAANPFLVPSKGKNVAGGKELMRAMLSKEAASNFSRTRLTPTIVKGLIPDDGFGSTALRSQSQMLDAAGSDVFNYNFEKLYGMGPDQRTIWNSFLSGQWNVKELTKALQAVTDGIAKDDAIKKIPVT